MLQHAVGLTQEIDRVRPPAAAAGTWLDAGARDRGGPRVRHADGERRCHGVRDIENAQARGTVRNVDKRSRVGDARGRSRRIDRADAVHV